MGVGALVTSIPSIGAGHVQVARSQRWDHQGTAASPSYDYDDWFSSHKEPRLFLIQDHVSVSQWNSLSINQAFVSGGRTFKAEQKEKRRNYTNKPI